MTYDLIREPWIPVRWGDGADGAPGVGLRDALADAHRIREVEASPLQAAALYRLLQAFFLRLYVHPDTEPDDSGWTHNAWRALWTAGHFDSARIDGYVERWSDRFDLLHPKRPFYGHPDPLNPNQGPPSWLVPTWAKGNNETLFDHNADAAATTLSLDAAARALVETQAYALGGLAGPGRLRFEDAPLSRGLVFWLRGRSLFEALLLNTPPATFSRMPSGERDLPRWERGAHTGTAPGAEEGYLDFLTWPSRHVRLRVTEDAGFLPVVSGVHIAQGKKWVSEAADPLGARRVKKDGSRYPFKLRPEQALWRASSSWLGLRLDAAREDPPRPFDWLASESGPGEMLPDRAEGWDVDVFGLANDKAKMEMIRADRVTVYPAVLRSTDLQQRIDEAVRRANRQAGSLRAALRTCAGYIATTGDAADVAEGLQGARRFWTLLDSGFQYETTRHEGFDDWLRALAALPGIHEGDALASEADRHLARWTRTLHRAALRAYDAATDGLVGTPRRMEAVARGRSEIRSAAAYKAFFTQPDPS